ncbi:MAG: hypothetical protein A2075_04450 [Geobacteraceae bacterium GWC2_58_44]|nr:MAG: hypothetical protein A2075_04450 [Geobacteraceae bacterium GWC2_58_44]
MPILAFCAFFSAAAITGSFYISHQFETSRQAKQFELTAIADLKAGQISNWYGDRMSDARLILKTPMIQRQAVKLLDNQIDDKARQELLTWMENVRTEYGYLFIALYGADGIARRVAPADASAPSMTGNGDFRAAVRAEGVWAGDLQRYRGKGEQEIHFDIMIPVGIHPGNAPAKGVWLLRVDPYHFLYPLVQSWPTPSSSAETLLVRQEGGDVLFLNELRHQPDSALRLRRPIDQYPDLASTQAIGGREGIVERLDYRNVPTLAAMRRVAGTPWFMVAKMDTDEIYAPLRERSRMTMLLLFALTVTAALGIGLQQRRRDARLLRLQLVSEQEANELLEKRVMQRTATLSEVNDRLSKEMAEQKRLETRLLAAKKMEAIGQLAGGVAHEVRNPLNAILSITEALFKEKEIEGNAGFEPYIQHIRTQVRRLAQLMNDLLDLGKPVPPADLQAVPLYMLCRETVDLWQNSRTADRRRVIIGSNDETAQLLVLADSVRLEQVLFNLLENAAQHSPDDAEIMIRLYPIESPRGDMVAIRIADSGKGVPMEKIDRVFEPFFTCRKGGTGLGLTLARHFIESMGGSVELCNNDPPPGFSVTVRLPMPSRERP